MRRLKSVSTEATHRFRNLGKQHLAFPDLPRDSISRCWLEMVAQAATQSVYLFRPIAQVI
jgi:hypothetical protein